MPFSLLPEKYSESQNFKSSTSKIGYWKTNERTRKVHYKNAKQDKNFPFIFRSRGIFFPPTTKTTSKIGLPESGPKIKRTKWNERTWGGTMDPKFNFNHIRNRKQHLSLSALEILRAEMLGSLQWICSSGEDFQKWKASLSSFVGKQATNSIHEHVHLLTALFSVSGWKDGWMWVAKYSVRERAVFVWAQWPYRKNLAPVKQYVWYEAILFPSLRTFQPTPLKTAKKGSIIPNPA